MGTGTIDEIARTIAEAKGTDGTDDDWEWIQTHISHVFLDAQRVYKLRKDTTLPFLDFGSRALRNADCLNELRLNRRLAPDVYLGVAPVVIQDDTVSIGAPRETLTDPALEHVVVMRRLPEGRDLLALVKSDAVPDDAIPAIARRLARFHQENGLGRPAPFSAEDWRARCTQPALDCLPVLEQSGLFEPPRLEALRLKLAARFEALAPTLEARRVEGRAIDGHGDLHLDHVWFETDESPPLLIDCLEFDSGLRQIDPASELAFLTMDLRYRERPTLAEWLLATYALETDDYGLFPLVDVFAAYRALVRAKVAALATAQPSIEATQRKRARESALRHLSLAEDCLETKASGELILVCGTVGCGKSTVARGRARDEGDIPIASDRVRKVLAGLDPSDHRPAATDEGLYRPEISASVYEGLLERAAYVLESGRTPLLDASFTKRADRDRVRRWAEARGLRARLLEVRCGVETARARLAAREREGSDPSDAGPDFLETSLARFEPPEEWPAEDHQIIRTDTEPASSA